jgi:hypothetical protein
MTAQGTSNRSWLAIASFIISLIALCTLPLPVIPSSLMGGVGTVVGIISLWRIRKKGGTDQDRFWATAGIVIGILPIISLCFTLFFIVQEIPRGIVFLSEKGSQLVNFLSSEFPHLIALLSNVFR